MKQHVCVGCGKILPAKSIKRREACKQGWRFSQIGRKPIFAHCGCMSRGAWNNYVIKKLGES